MMMSFGFADNASNAIGPIFVTLIAEEFLLAHGTFRERFLHTARFWGRVTLCMGIAVLMAEQGKAHQIWQGEPGFPSGHSTFAASAACCLVLQRGKGWLLVGVPLTLMMGAALIYCGYHTREHVIGGWILGTTVPYILWRLTDVKSHRSPSAGAPTLPPDHHGRPESYR